MSTPLEITKEELRRAITLTQALPHLRGRAGRTPSIDTVRLWARASHGWHGPDGSVVVLKTVLLNQQLLTLVEWCEEFDLARIRANQRARQARAEVAESLPRTPRRRAAAHKRAEERLRKKGVLRTPATPKPEPEPAEVA